MVVLEPQVWIVGVATEVGGNRPVAAGADRRADEFGGDRLGVQPDGVWRDVPHEVLVYVAGDHDRVHQAARGDEVKGAAGWSPRRSILSRVQHVHRQRAAHVRRR